MNIFYLDPNPLIAANYHCNQHLSKMVLESAQLLSTAYHSIGLDPIHVPDLYKPAYQGHPCTQWTCQSVHNMRWLIELCYALESERMSVGMNPHSSMDTVIQIKDVLDYDYPQASAIAHTSAALAMPAWIKYKTSMSETEKYQQYYQWKHRQWHLTKGVGMSYKGRTVPEFMRSESNIIS